MPGRSSRPTEAQATRPTEAQATRLTRVRAGRPTQSPVTRLTQAERSAATKRAVVEATITCLAERGYAGASTTDIARRAGVSRGALLHHYPTKAALVAAAMRHLFDERAQEVARRLTEAGPGGRTLEHGIDVMWELISGPSFRAGLTLVDAALADGELRLLVQEVMSEFDTVMEKRFAESFPEVGGRPFGGAIVRFAFSVLEAAALYRELGLESRAQEMVGALRVVAAVVVPQLAAGMRAEPVPEPVERLRPAAARSGTAVKEVHR